jgi:signal transduction histidine kinase
MNGSTNNNELFSSELFSSELFSSDLFSSDLWQRALESYASAIRLTIELFDAEERVVFGPLHSTPLFHLFEARPRYDPGLFGECARQCLAQTDDRPAVVSEFCGLTVIGTSLMLDGRIVGAAVAGYAFMDFCQLSEVERLVRNSGIRFDRLWQVAREQKPVSRQRLVLNAELLQVLGDAILRENSQTRQYGAALTRSEAQLRALTARVVTSQEEERRRVARDLHDDICQKLAIFEIDINQIEPKVAHDPDAAMRDLRQLGNKIGSLSEEVRHISYALHPSVIEDLGLLAALRSLREDFAARENMIVTLVPKDVPERVPNSIATGLYRITQEALRNVVKHAGRTQVKVVLTGSTSCIRLEIVDFGPGFDMRAPRAGLGLTSMEERARMMNGSFRIDSEPGEGTRVTVDVPTEAGTGTTGLMLPDRL